MRITDPVWDDEPCPKRIALNHISGTDGRCPFCGQTCFMRTEHPRESEASHGPMAESPLPDIGPNPDPDPPLPGICLYCRRMVARTWPYPALGARVCADHLYDAMRRATWPHAIRRIDRR